MPSGEYFKLLVIPDLPESLKVFAGKHKAISEALESNIDAEPLVKDKTLTAPLPAHKWGPEVFINKKWVQAELPRLIDAFEANVCEAGLKSAASSVYFSNWRQTANLAAIYFDIRFFRKKLDDDGKMFRVLDDRRQRLAFIESFNDINKNVEKIVGGYSSACYSEWVGMIQLPRGEALNYKEEVLGCIGCLDLHSGDWKDDLTSKFKKAHFDNGEGAAKIRDALEHERTFEFITDPQIFDTDAPTFKFVKAVWAAAKAYTTLKAVRDRIMDPEENEGLANKLTIGKAGKLGLKPPLPQRRYKRPINDNNDDKGEKRARLGDSSKPETHQGLTELSTGK